MAAQASARNAPLDEGVDGMRSPGVLDHAPW